MPRLSVGDRIRRCRIELGLTQTELGGSHYSKGYISMVERGRLSPSNSALEYFAAQLHRTPTWFLLDPLEISRRLDAELAAARDSLRNGDSRRATEHLREAARSAMDLDDGLKLATVHEHSGHLQLATGDISGALRSYREGMRLYAAADAVPEQICCTLSLVNGLLTADSLEQAKEELAGVEALCAARAVKAGVVLGRVALARGLVCLASDRPLEAREALVNGVTVLESADSPGHANALVLLGLIEVADRQWRIGATHLQQAVALLRGTGARRLAAAAGQWAVEAWSRLGQWDEALAAAQQCVTLHAAAGDRRRATCAAVRLAEISLSAGLTPGALAAASEARAGLRECPEQVEPGDARLPGSWRALCELRLAHVETSLARLAGDFARAERRLKIIADELAAFPAALVMRTRALHERAACLIALGRQGEASACYAQALAAIELAWPTHDLDLPSLREVCRLPSPLWCRT